MASRRGLVLYFQYFMAVCAKVVHSRVNGIELELIELQENFAKTTWALALMTGANPVIGVS